MNEAVATIEPLSAPRSRAAAEAAKARLSLSEPLPADVFSGSAGLLTGYRAYPTFSAPWLWRRTVLFGAAAGTLGLAQALILALELHDTRLGVLAALVGVPIWLVIVTAGPTFATIVRHQRLPPQSERAAMVVAIIAGVMVSCAGQYGAQLFSRATVAPRFAAYYGISVVQLTHAPGPYALMVQWAWATALFLCLGGGLALRTFFREQRLWSDARHARELAALRREKNEADLRLTVLQAQVEPHFLFNTLASIHALIRKDPDRAEAAMEALVRHLRATLPRLRADVGSTHSTLDQQIDICESYLALMRVRMGSRLRFAIEVPEPLRRHPFPPLMLISLVENAIKHGIEPSASGGNVVVSAQIEPHAGGTRLAVSVVDDGVGLKSELGGGMGLRNIREQLAARYGAQGALRIRGRTVGGVSATILVPCEQPMP